MRKSPLLTAAGLAANRRNARKSTGPRTPRGKAQSSLNGLRNGGRSRLYARLMDALYFAPPGQAEHMLRRALTPEQAAHPLIATVVESTREAEIGVMSHFDQMLRRMGAQKAKKFDIRSRNVVENKGAKVDAPTILMKSLELPGFAAMFLKAKRDSLKKGKNPQAKSQPAHCC